MPSLRELQAAFVASVFDRADTDAAISIDAGAMTQPAVPLPYLGDLARLEWHLHEACHAADHQAVTLDRLAALPPQRWPAMSFKLHPACRLFESHFPMHLIWQANQGAAAAGQVIDLAVGGVRLLLRRPAHVVELEAVDPAESAMLIGLSRGLPLDLAMEGAFAVAADFDLAAFLRQRVIDATVVDFAVSAS